MPPETQNNNENAVNSKNQNLNLSTSQNSNHNKKNVLIFAFIFVLVIIGIYFSYRFLNTQRFPYSNQEAQQVIQEKDEMLNWKTYRNEKYGFEFKYPAILFDDVRETPTYSTLFSAYGERGEIFVHVINEKLNLNAEVGPNHPDILVKDLKTLEINNLTAYEYNFGDGGLTARTVLFEFGNNTLKFNFVFSYGVDTSPNVKPLVRDEYLMNQILSTFKFIPPSTSVQ